ALQLPARLLGEFAERLAELGARELGGRVLVRLEDEGHVADLGGVVVVEAAGGDDEALAVRDFDGFGLVVFFVVVIVCGLGLVLLLVLLGGGLVVFGARGLAAGELRGCEEGDEEKRYEAREGVGHGRAWSNRRAVREIQRIGGDRANVA